jgi:hypothetical protein
MTRPHAQAIKTQHEFIEAAQRMAKIADCIGTNPSVFMDDLARALANRFGKAKAAKLLSGALQDVERMK